jgi:hypothetical protein
MSDIIQINPEILKIGNHFIKISCIYGAHPDNNVIHILLTNGNIYKYTIKNKHEVEWVIKKLSELIPTSTVIPYYTTKGMYSTYLITPQFITGFILNKNPGIEKPITDTEIIPPIWTIDITISLPHHMVDEPLIRFPINIYTNTLSEMESSLESAYITYETMLINFISGPSTQKIDTGTAPIKCI